MKYHNDAWGSPKKRYSPNSIQYKWFILLNRIFGLAPVTLVKIDDGEKMQTSARWASFTIILMIFVFFRAANHSFKYYKNTDSPATLVGFLVYLLKVLVVLVCMGVGIVHGESIAHLIHSLSRAGISKQKLRSIGQKVKFEVFVIVLTALLVVVGLLFQVFSGLISSEWSMFNIEAVFVMLIIPFLFQSQFVLCIRLLTEHVRFLNEDIYNMYLSSAFKFKREYDVIHNRGRLLNKIMGIPILLCVLFNFTSTTVNLYYLIIQYNRGVWLQYQVCVLSLSILGLTAVMHACHSAAKEVSFLRLLAISSLF